MHLLLWADEDQNGVSLSLQTNKISVHKVLQHCGLWTGKMAHVTVVSLTLRAQRVSLEVNDNPIALTGKVALSSTRKTHDLHHFYSQGLTFRKSPIPLSWHVFRVFLLVSALKCCKVPSVTLRLLLTTWFPNKLSYHKIIRRYIFSD
jgi:hypothetical protein